MAIYLNFSVPWGPVLTLAFSGHSHDNHVHPSWTERWPFVVT